MNGVSSPVGNALELPLGGGLQIKNGDVLGTPMTSETNISQIPGISGAKVLSNGFIDSLSKLGDASAGGIGTKALGQGSSIMSPVPISHGITTNQINR